MRRYERYKDTKIEWLGQIPKHWEIKKLRYLFNFNTGLSVTKAEFIEDGINCINYGDIHARYSFKLDLTNAILPKIDATFIFEKPTCLLSKNDLVFFDTSEDLDGVGNCVVISNLNGLQLLSGSHTIAAKPKQLLDSVFIRYSLMSKIIKSTIENKVTGIKVFSITQSILNSISVTFPPLYEQQQIADYLDQQTAKIDVLVQKQNKLIETLQEKKKSLINHVVTKGLNPDVPMKDSGIEWLGQIPKHWEMKKLKYLAIVRDVKQPYINDYDYIGLENIESWTGRYLPSKEEQHIEGIANLCFSGDVLFGKLRPYLAKCIIANKQSLCSTEILVLEPFQMINQLIQYYMLSENFINDVNGSTYGTKMPRASWEYLRNLKLPLQSLTEQQQIASYLDQQTAKINELINKSKSMVELLKEHKQSLINHVVTGKIKVFKDFV